MKRPIHIRVRRAACWTICWGPAIALHDAQRIFPRAHRLNRIMCGMSIALSRLSDRILCGRGIFLRD